MKRLLQVLLVLLALSAGVHSAAAQAVAVTLRLDTNVLGICRTTTLRVFAQVVPSLRTNSDRIFSWYVDVLNTNGSVASASYAALVKSASDKDSQTSSNGFTEGANRRGIYDTFLNLPGAGVTNPVELLAIPITPLALGQTRFRVQHGSGVSNLAEDFIVAPLGGGNMQTGGDYGAAFVDLTVVAATVTTATALTNVTNACPGNSVMFSTTASGTGPFIYQWTKNGATISGATANSYTIVSAAAGDAATYCVIVNGLCNSVTNCATLTVRPPATISCPATITTNICGTNVVVSFANPMVTGGALRGCVPASGTVFSLGTNAVLCTATNACGTNSCTFNVTVIQPAIPPVVTCPGNITTQCTSAAGAIVNFSASALDDCDGARPVICMPPSGSTFSFGTNTVTCTATDTRGNLGSCSFKVTVNDPTIVSLSIALQGTNVLISWPITCAYYQLQSTPTLNSPIPWVPVSKAPAIVNNRYQVILAHNAPREFFRLARVPCAAVPVPLLIELQGPTVVVSWPVTCAQLRLQSTPSLNAPITWQSVTNAPALINTRYRVTLLHAAPRQLFRLIDGP